MDAAPYRRTWKTYLAFAIIYLVWGSTFLAIRVGVREVPPLKKKAKQSLRQDYRFCRMFNSRAAVQNEDESVYVRGEPMKAKILAVMTSCFLLVTVPVRAQEDRNDDLKPHNATGCLMKLGTSNAYTLTDENGKTWSLHSTTVKLAPHVGHTIMVTGTIPTRPPDAGDTSPQNDLLVTKVEKVRNQCTQP